MKLTDCILFSCLVGGICYAGTESVLPQRMRAALGAICLLLTLCLLMFFRSRYRAHKTPSADETMLLFALMGTEAATLHLQTLLPPDQLADAESNCFIRIDGEQRRLIYNAVRTNAAGEEDVAKAYRTAVRLKADEVVFLARQIPRKAMILASRLPSRFRFVDPYTFKRYLLKHNALPEQILVSVKRKPMDWKRLPETVFSRGRIKGYLGISLLMLAFSFLTPLKTYYLILALIPLVLAATALLYHAFRDAR